MESQAVRTILRKKVTLRQRLKAYVAVAMCISSSASLAIEFTEKEQKRVIDGTLEVLKGSIYTKEQIAQLDKVLNINFVELNYAGYEDKTLFAQKLTKDIASKLGTDAIILSVSASTVAPEAPVSTLNVQHALGNVAIIDVDFNATHRAVDEAFAAIKKSDALVLDLRGDEKGNLDTMRYFAGYLLGNKTPITQLIDNKQAIVLNVESYDIPSDKSRVALPIYILTNSATAGVAESFAVAMQQQRSAFIVGENTAGQVNLTARQVILENIQITYPVATAIEMQSKLAIEGIGITPDLPVVSILSLKQAHELAKVAAIKYRVEQGRATPEEQYSLYRETIEYGDWQYAKGKCLVSYRVAEPRFNEVTKKYQFPFQVKFYGTGKSKVNYELGNSSGKMKQTVHFYDRDDIKSGISVGFASHLPLTIKRCKSV